MVWEPRQVNSDPHHQRKCGQAERHDLSKRADVDYERFSLTARILQVCWTAPDAPATVKNFPLKTIPFAFDITT